jgi:hypothetical protein
MIFFTKRRNLEGFFASKLFDMALILNTQVKYLGVKFHIDNRIWKAMAMPKGNRKIGV